MTATPDRAAASPPAWKTDRLVDSLVVLLVMTAAQRLIGLVRGLLFCRWLDPAELGQWDLALGFVEMAAPLAMLGLPGSFGRYVEHYREQGQLRTFLRRTTIGTGVVATLAIVLMMAGRRPLSRLVLGSDEDSGWVYLLAASVVAVGSYYFLTTLLTALRRSRVVSGLEFMNSALFAALAIGMMSCYSTTAFQVVTAYSIACLATGGVALYCLKPIWRSIQEPATELSQRALWSKLLPFAAWVWGTNWLSNLFDLADRTMIVHAGRMDPAQALSEVGNYHSARIVPMLLVSITGLLGTMITPYLSHDWERRGREAVSQRLNLTLKLLSIALLCGATAILLAAPLLFGVAFQGKFAGGRAVLPYTLAYCVWFGLARVAQKYLWCAERVGWAAAAWTVGLLLNIGLNLVLLPRYGLPGVVLATAAGNLAALVTLYGLNRAHGMRLQRGTCLLSAAPAWLFWGPASAAVGTVVMLVIAVHSDWLFDAAEKQQFRGVVDDYLVRCRGWASPRFPTQATVKEVT